ncbi:ankyrin repeat-containing protein [Penicillium cinerascens]|uniref:Ankyrin repeat-containing protein n=1 Tax=Penicillium cinerascens TaxID=70096 RepID=A0A9W9SZH7_9EURO|nr:ankyrin repeat-containing protein [Penicillium cinerascens]KAJ5203913.1 ankyrin repeat-containing protein [Penicillium cinerascens]
MTPRVKETHRRPRYRLNKGNTALHLAAIRGNHSIVRSLLALGTSIELKSRGGNTALVLAVKHRHQRIAHILLEEGAKPDARDSAGYTCMHRAIKTGLGISMVSLLLQHGADILAQGPEGQTPLHIATGQRDVVTLLLQHGADIFAKDDGHRTPFDNALQQNDYEMFEELVKKAKELSRNTSDPIYQICGVDLFRNLQRNIQSGNNARLPEVVDEHYRPWRRLHVIPTLHAVILAGNAELARAIIRESWVDVNVTNINEQTALHLAAAEGQHSCLLVLLDHGANINAQDMFDETPLYLAAVYGARRCFRTLLEYKADVSVLRSSSETPWSLPERKISKDFLRLAGVDV